MPTPYRFWVAVACWMGAAFRYHALFANHFHADEALFASWARLIAVWRDPLLLAQPVDKPPLLFYLQALFYPFFGPVEWAARMPSFIVSLLLVPALGLLAWRLYGDGLTAVVAAVFLALSPLAIQFSATAFTDPMLTWWLVVALILTVRPVAGPSARVWPGLAGLSLGLAMATKYQAALFLPLLLALAWQSGWSRRDWLAWTTGVVVVGATVLLWQLARTQAEPLLSLQLANVGGLRPAWSWELAPRLSSWTALSGLSLGWPVLLVVGVSGLLLLALARHHNRFANLSPVDGVLALFILAYLALHWLLAVPVWDRYLLPVLPLVLLLVARLATAALRWLAAHSAPTVPARLGVLFLVLAATVSLLVPAGSARLGRFPLGGQPTADHGAWQIARQLRDAGYGTVLYDHWYSWQWRYHLFDTGVYVSWFPHSDALSRDLAVFGGDGAPRYLVLPDSPAAAPVRRAAHDAGFALAPVALDHSGTAPPQTQMTLYRLEKANP